MAAALERLAAAETGAVAAIERVQRALEQLRANANLSYSKGILSI